MQRIRIWDLPTRLFHWLLAAAVIGLIVTAKIGGNTMDWHFRLGYAVLALLIFRLLWGFIGGYWSRFASFWPTPGRLKAHLLGDSATDVAGHSPLGALSVLAMLLVLLAQVLTGLCADDEIMHSGPLTPRVSNATVDWATSYHAVWGQYLVIGLVVLHLLAIVFYALRGHRLVPPMIVGDKTMPATTRASRDTLGMRLLALVLIALAGGLVYALVQWGHAGYSWSM